MKLLLVTTCGTSVLTNDASEDVRRWLVKIANHRQLDAADAGKLSARAAERGNVLAAADDATRRRLSAEFAGIGAVLDRLRPSRVVHVLIHTDTAAGEAATDIVAKVLRADGHEAQLVTAGGLRTDDVASFRAALADLTKEIENFAKWRNDGWFVYFNLTGGFKSINGYLQALGMIHADRCGFLYEGSRALMEIPRLPVRLAEVDELRAHIDIFRRLDAGYRIDRAQVEHVPEALLLPDDQRVTTSVWGDVVWARVRKALLAERLLEPLSRKLELAGSLSKDFKKATTEERVDTNVALDALSAHLDAVQKVLKSHTFKQLGGNPVPPSTHELFVTSGSGARRLYGHYRDGRFVVDALGAHL